MKNKLFPAPAVQCMTTMEPAFSTPFGAIRLAAKFSETIVLGSADAVFRIDSETDVLLWEHPWVHAELLIKIVRPDLPDGMSVSGCLIGVWRIRAKSPLTFCEFSALWSSGEAPVPGGPDSGQYFAVQTWDDGRTTLSLGTTDEVFLHYYGAGREMPASWKTLVKDYPLDTLVAQEIGDLGLRVRLPEVLAGEVGQVHFVTAWAPTRIEDASTYFTVGLNPARVLTF